MEKYLPYITDITAILAILGFVFSVWKYLDIRDREEKRRNHENLNKILEKLSGKMLDNGEIKIEISFLLSNIYQLLEFKNYSEIILPVLEYLKECPIRTDEKSLEHYFKAIEYVENKLKTNSKNNAEQIAAGCSPRNDNSTLVCHCEERL